MEDFVVVVWEVCWCDDLEVIEACAVGECDEGESCFGVSACAYPAFDGDGFAGVCCECLFDLEPGWLGHFGLFRLVWGRLMIGWFVVLRPFGAGLFLD